MEAHKDYLRARIYGIGQTVVFCPALAFLWYTVDVCNQIHMVSCTTRHQIAFGVLGAFRLHLLRCCFRIDSIKNCRSGCCDAAGCDAIVRPGDNVHAIVWRCAVVLLALLVR